MVRQAGASVVLGVTGSIAAYKAADLASRLTKVGFSVDVVMTPAALEFVRPITFQSLTHRTVMTEMFAGPHEMSTHHISLAERASILVVAPASANTIAKLALGFADNALTSTALATRAPLVLAPAMNTGMWENPATQANLAQLRMRGAFIIEPGDGYLACGSTGRGRMAEPEHILDAVLGILGRGGDLAGRHVVVTSGGTREPIDPVRYITNRSSGKMGLALALSARDRGAKVTLITASPPTRAPWAMKVVPVVTADEMLEAVRAATHSCDCLIMAAAPADYKVDQPSSVKLKKEGATIRTVTLVPNHDIVASVSGSFIKVAFAAESEDLVANARRKLASKGAVLVVANDVTEPGAGFDVDTNRVTLIHKDGSVEPLALMSKRDVAEAVVDRVVRLLQSAVGD